MMGILFLIGGPKHSQHGVFFTGTEATFKVSHSEGE